MGNSLVSISCTTFNHAPFIRQCLDGFLMQKCDFEYEILIHDDASTDGTIEIIREYESNYPAVIKPIIQKENQWSKGVRGMNDTYNFSRAQGKYIAFCEGDDYWTDPFKLQKQVNLLEDNPDIVLCSHNVNRVDESDKIIGLVDDSNSVEYFSSPQIFHAYFPTLSLVFRNVKLQYTDELRTALNGDSVLTGLLSSYGGAAHMGFNGANYRIHQGGIYRRSSYLSNQKKSIKTRRIMLKSASFDDMQKKEIRKNIALRKKRSVKYALKTFKIRDFVEILFA